MKKWECPECKELTDYLIAEVIGTCTVDTNDESEMSEWEIGDASCEHCGFEENSYSSEKFKLIKI